MHASTAVRAECGVPSAPLRLIKGGNQNGAHSDRFASVIRDNFDKAAKRMLLQSLPLWLLLPQLL